MQRLRLTSVDKDERMNILEVLLEVEILSSRQVLLLFVLP